MKGQVIISYYPVSEILELYPDDKWDRVYVESTVSLANSNTTKSKNRRKATELILIRKNNIQTKEIKQNSNIQLSLFLT